VTFVLDRMPRTSTSPIIWASSFFAGLAETFATSNPAAANAEAASGWMFSRSSAFMGFQLYRGRMRTGRQAHSPAFAARFT